MGLQIYLDGQFVDQAEAKISVFDHGLLYGDGIFEGIRVYQGCIFRLREHLERLYSSAKYLMLDVPLAFDDLIAATVETVRRNALRDGYIRLVVTRGVGDLGLAPWKCKKASIFIIAAGITLYPAELYEKGLDIVTVPTRRNNPDALNPRVKSLNYLNNIMAKIEGRLAGVEEALMLDAAGYVAECTGDNIFLIQKGVLRTPPVYLGALKGITRDCVIELARQEGLEVREEPFTRFEVYDSDECFLTGTAAEAIPVVKVDGRPIGDGKPGPVTRRLIAKFREQTSKDGVMVQY
ncbi:MAG: Branched-chain-amino-acid aminotransferase [candidate division BRC1 bacterium ADurb.BinA364]|nr:MAG: Branched-chain-amino-acid aminotransferase [candidate division BRC1 bacterium ADurb.BinA364]